MTPFLFDKTPLQVTLANKVKKRGNKHYKLCQKLLHRHTLALSHDKDRDFFRHFDGVAKNDHLRLSSELHIND